MIEELKKLSSPTLIILFIFLVLVAVGFLLLGKNIASKDLESQRIISNPLSLPNPASENCQKLGGELKLEEQNNRSIGICTKDGQTCEEWALFRGECTFESTPSGNLANPASVNCATQGGKLVIKERGDGGQYGVCDFEDGMMCEEWALFRGDCPIGGVKTTGFDTPEQIYCAILGGETLAVENATCKFNDGSSCSDLALYNGQCHKGKY